MLLMMVYENVVVIFWMKTVKAQGKETSMGFRDYSNFLTRGLVSVHDILTADFVSMNICNFIY